MKYSSQHQNIRRILTKQCIKMGSSFKTYQYVSDQPSITFCKAPSLKDTLLSSHYIPPLSRKTDDLKLGNFPCGSCNYCKYILPYKKVIFLPRRITFVSRHHTTCNSTHVVYLMICQRGAFYVGKTKRRLQQRIHDHIYLINSGRITTPISKHVGLKHNFDMNVCRFLILDHIVDNGRKGDLDTLTLRSETKWIYTLKANIFPGLNEQLSFTPFL